MNKETLKSICNFGNFTAICFAHNANPDFSWLETLASSLSTEKPSLILDTTNQYNAKHSFSDFISNKSLAEKVFSLPTPSTDPKIQTKELTDLIKDIISFQKDYPEIILLFSSKNMAFFQPLLLNCQIICFYAPNQEASEELENSAHSLLNQFTGTKIWTPTNTIPTYWRKHFLEYISYSKNKEQTPENLASILSGLRKISILKKNSLSGAKKWFYSLVPFLLLLFLFFSLFIPKPLDGLSSSVRDMKHDRRVLSKTPFFDFTFNGTESLQRISRYAIGKFHATVTNPKMVTNYIRETLEKNEFAEDIPKKNDIFFPKTGTTLRFYPSEVISTKDNSDKYAWQFFTGMISDSIAYITELYNEKATESKRLHKGIDVASSHGARILAPFAAKAWTFLDERGGTILGLANKEFVILFMHCDQVLYLNGQNVMAGDPIATIGITGRTTGPHAHIVTGIVSHRGDKMLGGLRYRVIDPIEWHRKFKKATK